MPSNVSMVVLIIAIVASVVITAVITAIITASVHKKSVEKKIGNAEEKARQILDEALRTADAKKREGLLEIKKESSKYKLRMNLIRKSRKEEPKHSASKEEFSRKKKMLIKSWKPWKRERIHLLLEKANLTSKKKQYLS